MRSIFWKAKQVTARNDASFSCFAELKFDSRVSQHLEFLVLEHLLAFSQLPQCYKLLPEALLILGGL